MVTPSSPREGARILQKSLVYNWSSVGHNMVESKLFLPREVSKRRLEKYLHYRRLEESESKDVEGVVAKDIDQKRNLHRRTFISHCAQNN